MKRSKGFTLIELLVVIGIIALLVAILMPALSKAKEMAKQIQCASQLNGIGKSVYMYMTDYKGAVPVAGTPAVYGGGAYNVGSSNTGEAGAKPRWFASNWIWADHSGTVGGSLYLLVKYEDLVPKMFVCPSAPNDEESKMDIAVQLNNEVENWSDLNDFCSGKNLSYSYHDPFGTAAVLDDSSSSGLVLMADKSHAFDTPTFATNATAGPGPKDANLNDWTDEQDDPANAARHGNSNNHRTQVQNVLFVDSHVKKYQKPTVGVADDNIYSHWPSLTANPLQKMAGQWGAGNAVHQNDTYLVN